MRKIYDCFCFFNELDLLEMRLNILNEYIDYFVISEASVTHTGQPKPYYFEENKERFKKFLPKIIHLKIEDSPFDFVNLPIIQNPKTKDEEYLNEIYKFIKEQTTAFNVHTQHHYGRDFFQKECIRRGLGNCKDEDVIISSDCDEIPNPEILKNIDIFFDSSKLYSFDQNCYYYYLNILKEKNWKGSRMGSFKILKNYSYNQLRNQINNNIENGGWHFSYMGGAEQIKKKIESFSAQEMNNPNVINSIKLNIDKNIDPYFRGNLTKVEIDESYPKYLLNNLDKYKHMIKY
jgi:beta-1,4-mannosyl-glycoprotein beta-1,4-N-acetylglucosaminyltransferase